MPKTPPKPTPLTKDQIRQAAQLNLELAASRFVDGADGLSQTEGLSIHQARALYILALHPDADDGLPMGVLADGLLTRAADTTRLIDRLVGAGLVTREPAAHDRRVVLVRPTAAGRDVIDRLEPKLRAARERFWHALSHDEVETLNNLLIRVLWTETEQGGT